MTTALTTQVCAWCGVLIRGCRTSWRPLEKVSHGICLFCVADALGVDVTALSLDGALIAGSNGRDRSRQLEGSMAPDTSRKTRARR